MVTKTTMKMRRKDAAVPQMMARIIFSWCSNTVDLSDGSPRPMSSPIMTEALFSYKHIVNKDIGVHVGANKDENSSDNMKVTLEM